MLPNNICLNKQRTSEWVVGLPRLIFQKSFVHALSLSCTLQQKRETQSHETNDKLMGVKK
jgi:hypothetical protein